MNRKVLFLTITFSLLFSIPLFACVQVLTVQALVPSIVNVDFRKVGLTVWVDIVISHEPPPAIGSSHYVSNVQLEINGVVTDLTQTPQSSTTFTVGYELGSNANSYSVRARALCNLHGYSGWSAIATYTSPSPTPTPTSTPSETLTPSGSPTPSLEPTEPPGLLPQEALYAIVIAAIGVAVVAVILILRKRTK
jgi:desulfoferrodoxin (superoxide reductase-like protein)